MEFVRITHEGGITLVQLARGKVNAISEGLTEELRLRLEEIEKDCSVKTVILTGSGKFFSFGLDIPEFLGYPKESFQKFVGKFAHLYTYLFNYPKPVIAALNGHTVAGGFMIATACDYRIMVSGSSRISLNEITFGSSLFPGSAVMLTYCVGSRRAETIALSGRMYSAEEAIAIGLVDQVAEEDKLATKAQEVAQDFVKREGPAFRSIKNLMRGPVAEEMRRQDKLYRDEMIDIWYSEDTWRRLQNIKIRG
jgi:Delta3-Delta2-enoyl-CoA isomerase